MQIFRLLDELLLDEELALSYTPEIEFSDILSTCKVSFKENDNSDYLEMLIYYLKVNNEYNNTSIVISNGLLNVLTKEEIELLEKELQFLQMNIIDISINTKEKNIKRLTVDDEWCVM